MTTVCASTQLARALVREDTRRRVAAGETLWETPDILSWNAWLRRQWEALAADPPEGLPLLMTPRQERRVWEQIISGTAVSSHIIDPGASAALAANANATVAAYGLPLRHSAWSATDDSAAFAVWHAAFERTCGENGWVSVAKLPTRLVPPEGAIELAGFDRLTPQQERFLQETGYGTRPLPVADSSTSSAQVYPDSGSELDAAAKWAAARLEASPNAIIGILDFQLAQNRAAWEVALAEHCVGRFTLASGVPLAGLPLPASALRLLELSVGGDTGNIHTLSTLLLSPFVKGYATERYKRAQLDTRLRKRSGPDVRLADAIRNDDCPQFAGVLQALLKARVRMPEEDLPSAWAGAFHQLLTVAGWPGDARLSASEYPVYEAWREALTELASLDRVERALSAARALHLLREILAGTNYERYSSGRGVAVMAPEAAYGAGFDALWIASAHDTAWPVSPQPNPFLPIALQRQFEIPAATNRHALPRARQFTLAWLAAAPEVIVSYAAAAQDAPQAISPLFAHLPRTNEPVAAPAVAGGLLESLADEAAPVAAPGAYQGGAKLFKLQASCPFRAFAEMRLKAAQLEEPYLGCSPRDHGSAIHKALEYCWSELGGSDALGRMPHEEMDALIERSVARALTERWSGTTTVHQRLRDVEHDRLCRLLGQWLREERQRVLPFQVLSIEAERLANVSGLEVKVRADRVDRLEGGGLVILDYKTGMDVKARWSGERPEEPQLPLYAAMAEEPVAAVALAQIHPKSRKFIGQAASPKALPGKQAALKPGDVDDWRHTMAGLAQEFLAGHATLMPGIETCRFCHLTSLCRKRDASGAEESDGG